MKLRSKLSVFFNPLELPGGEASQGTIYIVIDAIRATTTIVVMFDQGAEYVFAAQTLDQAKAAKERNPERWLCGEREAQIAPGCDYGNSPNFFAQHSLTGRELILTTSNGTQAFFACPAGSTCLAGSFYNAEAVVEQALELAQKQNTDIAIVCAAEYGCFALEDSACAGCLAQKLLRRRPDLDVFDSTHAAITLYEAYPPARLREYTRSAHDLIKLGQEKDLVYCLDRPSASNCVPVVVGRETGLLVLDRLV